ncbi:hypothetical protein AB1Y20_021255 [Prymnesium parvum]|uniref:Glycosyl transferase 64 domain-containing protein n=1 Tax=Prymnesium parvum TaxID=97485 RepID=A0AB34JLH3_PRYPA
MAEERVTLLLTCGSSAPLRITWCYRIIQLYGTTPFRPVIAKRLVLWNSVQPLPAAFDHFRRFNDVEILETNSSSLNNRWIGTLAHTPTFWLLNLDDDIFVSAHGIRCLVAHCSADSILGTYGRLVMESPISKKIVYSVIRNSSDLYSMVLPRIMLLSRWHLRLYSNASTHLHQYVDDEESHSDDILMNFVVPRRLRVLLPGSWIVDLDKECSRRLRSRASWGGLGLHPNRKEMRASAGQYFARYTGWPTASNVTAQCNETRQASKFKSTLNYTSWCHDLLHHNTSQLLEGSRSTLRHTSAHSASGVHR